MFCMVFGVWVTSSCEVPHLSVAASLVASLRRVVASLSDSGLCVVVPDLPSSGFSDTLPDVAEKELQKHNRDLQKKLKEKEDSNASSLGPCTDPEPLDPKGNSDGLSAMTYEGDSLPTLNIGVYANSPSDEVRQSTGMQAGTSCVLLPWMLPRVNS